MTRPDFSSIPEALKKQKKQTAIELLGHGAYEWLSRPDMLLVVSRVKREVTSPFHVT